MKKTILLLLMVAITGTLAALSWHYFGDDNTGILRGKNPEVKSWLPLFLRVHIAGGMLAMAAGALLVFTTGHSSRWLAHRRIGQLYALSVGISGLLGAVIAPYAIGGLSAALGFLSLATAWLYFTARSVFFALRGDLVRHRRAAVFSLALTYSSLTFRLFLLIPLLTEVPFVPIYRMDSWVSWLLHLGIAAWWLRRRQSSNRPATILPA